MELVNELCDLLQYHMHRDKVVSLSSYVLKLWGSSADRPALLAASGRLAVARATLRLFDDAAALRAAAAYGLGAQEGPVWGSLGALGHACTLLYLQAEKLVWLLDCGVVTLGARADARARTAHKLFWSLGALIGFIRSLKALHGSALAARAPDAPACAGARQRQAALGSARAALELVHAVSWLPPRCLWGGALGPRPQAAVAAAAATLALLLHYRGKRLASTK